MPLADARGSETTILSRDREGAVVKNKAGRHTRSLLLPAILLAGCAVGPNYKRPAVNVPDSYRGAGPSTEQASLGDEQWAHVFQDEQLRKLIDTAVRENYDVRIAATRILQAQAQLGITRADQLPTVFAEATTT
jgi:multidrug efflux system outer membrane protein